MLIKSWISQVMLSHAILMLLLHEVCVHYRYCTALLTWHSEWHARDSHPIVWNFLCSDCQICACANDTWRLRGKLDTSTGILFQQKHSLNVPRSFVHPKVINTWRNNYISISQMTFFIASMFHMGFQTTVLVFLNIVHQNKRKIE